MSASRLKADMDSAGGHVGFGPLTEVEHRIAGLEFQSGLRMLPSAFLARGGKMAFAVNRGVRIRYETVGEGPALVLHHGVFGSSRDWFDLGFVEALKNHNRLVLVDARGHGESDKPHDHAAYDLNLRAADVVAVLDDLDVRKANFMGYSMGGWIGFGAAKYFPDRFSSFIIGAAHPYAESTQAYRGMVASQEAFTAAIDQAFTKLITPAWRARLLANDFEALRALIRDRESIADVLPTMTMPCLLFVGDLDPRLAQVQQCASQMPNAAFFNLPGCDHIRGFVQSDTIIPKVNRFLREIPTAA